MHIGSPTLSSFVGYSKMLILLTLGPQRGPFVAQQISVLQTVHLIQSLPAFFCTRILQFGQCMASPFMTSFCALEWGIKKGGLHVHVVQIKWPQCQYHWDYTHLQHFPSGSGSIVIHSPSLEIILVLLTVHSLVDRLKWGRSTTQQGTAWLPLGQKRTLPNRPG